MIAMPLSFYARVTLITATFHKLSKILKRFCNGLPGLLCLLVPNIFVVFDHRAKFKFQKSIDWHYSKI